MALTPHKAIWPEVKFPSFHIDLCVGAEGEKAPSENEGGFKISDLLRVIY